MGNNSKPDVWILSETPAMVMKGRLTSVHGGDGADAGVADGSPLSGIVLGSVPEVNSKAIPVATSHGPLIACLVRDGEDENEVETYPIGVFGQLSCKPSSIQRILRAEVAFAEVRDANNGLLAAEPCIETRRVLKEPNPE